MAETVYKKISELDTATLPLAGTEYLEVSQTGASKKALLSGWFGAGWWAKLTAAFSAFVAPDSLHADNADTLGTGEEAPVDFHDATQLVGAVPLGSIPAELTGKNAATADTANAIEGLSLSAGSAGTYGTKNIDEDTSWVIPAGLYIITYVAGGTAVLQIYSGTDWRPTLTGTERPPATGLILSDGTNYRITAKDTNTTIYYRKLL